MNNKNILVVYNICGITRDNINMWLNHLEDIVNQNYPNFKVAISGCVISDSSKRILEEFKNQHNNVVLNFTDDILPVNVTFNHTAQVCTDKFGLFDAYLYVASDVKFVNDSEVLSKLVHLHFNSNSAITAALVDNDHGLDGIYPDVWDELNNLLETDHFRINIGRTANMHVFLFDKEIYEKYNRKIIPDIFASHCTETTYSYIAASLSKIFVMHNKNIMLKHIGYMDGHSAGFIEEIKWDDKIAWKHLFKSKTTVEERLLNDEGKECGFGYTEGRGILPHNEEMYDENENHKDPQRLLNFIKTGIYLSQDEFDYNNIKYQLII
jgi:hypothetical protein